jgi:nickel-dependent lactate racemase
MSTHLRYDRGELALPLADSQVEVLRQNILPVVPDARAAILASYANPIGTPPLAELARGRESAVISICDVTRPVPNEAILLPMIETLIGAGIARDKITILVATGLHRPNLGAELEEMIGAKLAQSIRVVNHDARDASTMTDLGEVPFGNGRSARIALNREWMQHDLKIATGLVEPHFMAGYSGGRKLVCPGIASASSIFQFHSPPMIGDPNARAGNLPNNPIHALSLAVACQAGVDFIVNVTLSETRELTGVFAGDLNAAHAAAIAHVDKQTKVPIQPAPIVVTSSAGYPLDTTLYQAIKGLVCALPAIEENGTMILVAGLTQGLGSEEFSRMCTEFGDVPTFMNRIETAFAQNGAVEIDQWQLQKLCEVLTKCRVTVVTDNIEAATLANCGMQHAPNLETALQTAFARHGENARVVAIPEGPYVTPVAVNSKR